MRQDSGQALVELALALPLLLLILVGIFEFARAYGIKQSLVNGAREGARVAVVQSPFDSAAVDSIVRYYLSSNNVAVDSLHFVANQADGTVVALGAANTGDAISVSVFSHYDFILVGPVLSLFGGSFRNGVDLGSRATMRKE
ncbi:MAG: pilus assembly protein [Gemmatimonadetes bacterium]|nr:pilus assembly protein [Gemmatimonadota bacterium]